MAHNYSGDREQENPAPKPYRGFVTFKTYFSTSDIPSSRPDYLSDHEVGL